MTLKYSEYHYEEKRIQDYIKKIIGIFLVFQILSLTTGCTSHLIYRPNDKQYLEMEDISPSKPFLIESYSGNKLNALLIPAQSKSNNTLLVHFHGNAGNITWTSQRYGWLKNYVYDLLVFDYSGYGSSTGRPSPEVISKDAITVLDYVRNMEKENRWDRIILAGTSMGGYVLLKALEE